MSREVTIKMPRLHAGQLTVVREARRFNILCMGRRFGKSVLGKRQIVHPVLEGKYVSYFCPTYKMLSEIWRDTRRVLKPITASANTSEHHIDLITGGIVDMWSLENYDSIRGRKYHRAIIDEAAMCANLKDAWQEVIRPTLTDYEGDAWFLSTPKGINFFKELYDRGQDPSQVSYASWQMPTLSNPYIKASEVEAARLELPSTVFTQEYEAAFLQNEGSVFRNIEACLKAVETRPTEHHGHRIVIGLDWAQATDYTVICVFCATCMCEVALDRFNKIEFAHQRGRVRAACDFWRVTTILAESNSIGSPNIEALAAEGLPVYGFTTTAQSKPQLIQSFALAFERTEAQWLPDEVAKSELVSYEATTNPTTGRVSYSAPSGQHDDTVISRALAFRAATQTGGTAEHGESLW